MLSQGESLMTHSCVTMVGGAEVLHARRIGGIRESVDSLCGG